MKKIVNKIFYCLCYLYPTIVLAAAGETPVSQGLSYVTSAMYGATGVAIATISVMIVGLLCLFHFCKWSTFGYTVMGICIIFGAPAIVNGITRLIHR
jgi:type IV secretory pathway VirB2 component (pilin)